MTKLGEKLLAAFLLDKGVIKDESHFQAWYEGARNGPPEGQTEYRNAVDGANRHWQQFERDGRLPFMLGTCRISFEWRKVHIQQADGVLYCRQALEDIEVFDTCESEQETFTKNLPSWGGYCDKCFEAWRRDYWITRRRVIQ